MKRNGAILFAAASTMAVLVAGCGGGGFGEQADAHDKPKVEVERVRHDRDLPKIKRMVEPGARVAPTTPAPAVDSPAAKPPAKPPVKPAPPIVEPPVSPPIADPPPLVNPRITDGPEWGWGDVCLNGEPSARAVMESYVLDVLGATPGSFEIGHIELRAATSLPGFCAALATVTIEDGPHVDPVNNTATSSVQEVPLHADNNGGTWKVRG